MAISTRISFRRQMAGAQKDRHAHRCDRLGGLPAKKSGHSICTGIKKPPLLYGDPFEYNQDIAGFFGAKGSGFELAAQQPRYGLNKLDICFSSHRAGFRQNQRHRAHHVAFH